MQSQKITIIPHAGPCISIRSFKIDCLLCARIFPDLYAHAKNTTHIVKKNRLCSPKQSDQSEKVLC